MRAVPVIIVLLGLSAARVNAQQLPDSLPDGVTSTMVEQGRLLYEGPGRCISCHGDDGRGVGPSGADLTDSVWVHSDGSFDAILAQIKQGVPKEHSTVDRRMPERGASRLTDNQLRFVAAYVWTLSRQAGGDQ